ncbi:MAG: B12-binding domain-containing protein [Phycisphaerae bacterium]|nr:B12-binding domain-containing protein [Phycisphaerae bacterium]
MNLKQHNTFSPRQTARAIGVSEASIKRWCDNGKLSYEKTVGGHRRLSLPVILGFIQDQGIKLRQPEVLDLPAAVGPGARTLEQACDLYEQALEQGDQARSLQIAFDMRLAGHSMAVIADKVVAPAFHALGERWQHGDVEVYQERHGVEITRRVLLRLKDTLVPPEPDAPSAIGATLSGDPYCLPGLMGELVLLELGWQAKFLGSQLPHTTLEKAVHDLNPSVLWLSVSSVGDPEAFVEANARLYALCLEHQCALVVGGSALTDQVRPRIKYASFGDSLQHLGAFAQGLSVYTRQNGHGFGQAQF